MTKKQKTEKSTADVHIENSTFNGPPHGVKLDADTARAISALAQAAERNADAIIGIAALVKGGDSYGLFVGTGNRALTEKE